MTAALALAAAPPVIRRAEPEDLEAIEALEAGAFRTDRLSRRSLRRFLQDPSDEMAVVEEDGRIVGYALVLLRSGTALARLYSIAVADHAAGRGLGRMLLEEAERRALARDAIILRLEVHVANRAAIALYESAGYRTFGRHEDYYEDGGEALRMEKFLVAPAAPRLAAPPYVEQTLDFTCGPCCMMMALGWADPAHKLDRALEIQLWREATTIFMTSGLGGCDPYGIAVALARRGLQAELRLSRRGPFFLEGVRSEEKRVVMRLSQEGFRREAQELGLPERFQPLSEDGLISALDDGAIAIVLVSGYRMFAKKTPHWLLVHGHDGRHAFVHDPWVADNVHETPSAAANLPIPIVELARMSRFGKDNLRAAILLRKPARACSMI